MVGMGATGETAFKPGVHLRLAFQKQLGFPPYGFALYRKPSSLPMFAMGLRGPVDHRDPNWLPRNTIESDDLRPHRMIFQKL